MRKTSGISLMLLIFLSLCLIIFSLLSLSGAVADETLSTQAADRTIAYYAAVSEANERLAEIDAQLASYLREAEEDAGQAAEPSPEDGSTQPQNRTESDPAGAEDRKAAAYRQLCSQIGDEVPGALWEDGVISFSVDVDEDQILQVGLDVAYPNDEEDSLYHTRTWKVVNVSDWTADNSMHLFRTEDLK